MMYRLRKNNEFKLVYRRGRSLANNLLVIYKNMPMLQLIFNLPFITLGFMIKYLFYIKRGLGKAYKEGIVLGFKEIRTSKKVTFRFKNIKNS